jgi:hypothetical protein
LIYEYLDPLVLGWLSIVVWSNFSRLSFCIVIFLYRSAAVWEELPVAMDQLPQTGHPARAVHGGGGEADHQPPRHCWQQVGCKFVSAFCLYWKWSLICSPSLLLNFP